MRSAITNASSLVLLVSCATSSGVPAATSRAVSPDAPALSDKPICFAPPAPTLGLIARDSAQRIIATCEGAATKLGVPVVSFGTPGCIIASMTWSAQPTGELDAECYPPYRGYAGCSSKAVHRKSVQMRLSLGPNGATIAEQTAVIRSDHASFNDQSFRVLCTAAFEGYPRQMSSERVVIGDEE